MSIRTLCRCGNYLHDNVIPNSFLRLLFSDEQIALLEPSTREANPQRTKKPRSKHRRKASVQRQVWFTENAKEAFECSDCGRLHIFWKEELLQSSYCLRLEKRHDEESDQLGDVCYWFLKDAQHDPVAEAFREMRSQVIESEAEADAWLRFQDCLWKSSCPIWFREEAQQIIIEWEQGWITEYHYEYGEPPLLL